MKVSMTMPQSRRSCASLDDTEVRLSPHEHALVQEMLLWRPKVVPMQDLIAAIWPNPDVEPENAVGQVRIYTCWLRKKGFPIAHGGYGRGYGIPDLMTQHDG